MFHYTYWMTGNLLKVGNIVGYGQTLRNFLSTLKRSKEFLERLEAMKES